MTKFLGKQHLLVKYGDTLCSRFVDKEINFTDVGIPIYSSIPSYTQTINVDLDNVIGWINLEKKEDGIYYTPSIFNSEFVDIVEEHKRNILYFSCRGTEYNISFISAAYLSNHQSINLFDFDYNEIIPSNSVELLDLLIDNLNNSNIPVRTTCTNPEYDYGQCIHVTVGNTELQLFTNADNSHICGVDIIKIQNK